MSIDSTGRFSIGASIARVEKGTLAAPEYARASADLVPLGEQPARFHRDAGVAVDAERFAAHVHVPAEVARASPLRAV